MREEFVICSNCFQRHGLKWMADRLGTKDGTKCPHCGLYDGAKLTLQQTKYLAWEYIVQGSYHRTTFCGSPIYMLTEMPGGESFFVNDPDIVLLESLSGQRAFQYGPATWRVGETIWLEDLQSEKKSVRLRATRKVIEYCEKKTCQDGAIFYRLLSHLYGDAQDPLTFEAPHWKYQKDGRFGLPSTSVLYLSSSIESAIHECRVTVEDELTLASIALIKPLKVVDLTETHLPSIDPSQDLSYSIGHICSAGEDAYPITQGIAREAYKQGFDGILYWSFFNKVSPEKGKNLALFGTPIKDNTVKVISIDRLLLNQIQYSFSLGVLV